MKRIISMIFIIFLAITVFIISFIFYFSPKSTPQFKNDVGNVNGNSIAEINDIVINAVKQRILIRGENISNPVLLHLHGGPGSPDHPFIKRDKADLEDIFTVCYWEHRGAGASYNDNIPTRSMTIDQIVQDGVQIVNYLRKKFGVTKIYIQGHSWGTVPATQMIFEEPNLFHAYFGIGQVIDMKTSDKMSYDFTVREAKEAHDHRTLEKLKEIGGPPYVTSEEWTKAIMVQRKPMRRYQDRYINRNESTLDIYKAFVLYTEYSIGDKIKALKGDVYSMIHLWPEVIKLNLFKEIPEYKIPVYFFHGKHDKTTVMEISKQYFHFLKAPVKEFYEFEKSAHSPQLEEFAKYKLIIKPIVQSRIRSGSVRFGF